MELNPVNRIAPMPQGHNRSILLCPGADFELAWKIVLRDHERMVAGRLKRSVDSDEHAAAVVIDRGRLAVHVKMGQMLYPRLVTTFGAAFAALWIGGGLPSLRLSGAAALMSVDEIRPGMVGTGRTVFDGTHVDEFKANIIGVLENVIGPSRNLILARLEGGPLANTGVIAGMERGRTLIGFEVKDDHSPIQKVEYSQDGQRWHGVFPVDGIADSKSERYELSIDGDIGERGVTLRASDAMNNVASAQVDRPLRP